jgi:hypothetical protein
LQPAAEFGTVGGMDDDYPGQINWSEHPSPSVWFAVPGNPGGHTSADSWTLSPDPKIPGWSTDAGCGGYGMPREVAEALAQRLSAAPPRPWHYVTEKLPEPGSTVGRFWVYFSETQERVAYGGYWQGEVFMALDPGPGDRRFSIKRGNLTGAWAYAWEPEPEPPPLPEAPSADDLIKADYLAGDPGVRGMVARLPVLGVMQADMEAAEAATISGDGCAEPPRGERAPVDPDLLQALKDAARMERKR